MLPKPSIHRYRLLGVSAVLAVFIIAVPTASRFLKGSLIDDRVVAVSDTNHDGVFSIREMRRALTNMIRAFATNDLAYDLDRSGTVDRVDLGLLIASIRLALAQNAPHAYIVNAGSETLQIYDTTNPLVPVSVGTVRTGSEPTGVAVRGFYAYVVNHRSNTLEIFNILDPRTPVSIGTVPTGSYPTSVAIRGLFAYVTNMGDRTLKTYSLSNLRTPTLLSTVATVAPPARISIRGRYAYVLEDTPGTTGVLQIFDLANPQSPVALGSALTFHSPHVSISGDYAYVAAGAYFDVYDLRNPQAPVDVKQVATLMSDLQGLAVHDQYAYIVGSDGPRHTLQVFSLTDPAAPVSVSSVSMIASSSDIAIEGSTLYVLHGDAKTLESFDLTDPAAPVSRGTVATGISPFALLTQSVFMPSPECGDGAKEGSEQCDDGNFIDTDDCTNSCKNPVCGDHAVWSGHEECDDQSSADGDGCSALCTVEETYACTGSPSVCLPPSTLANGLDAYWKLDETGRDYDPSRFSFVDRHPLYVNNGPTLFSAPGKIGNALLLSPNPQIFQGWSTLTNIGTINRLANANRTFTIGAWINLGHLGGSRLLHAKTYDGTVSSGPTWTLRHRGGVINRFSFTIQTADGVDHEVRADSFGAPEISTWYFVTGTFDPVSKELSLRINAGKPDSVTVSGTARGGNLNSYYPQGSDDITVGPGKGHKIDEFGIWSRVLTPQEISALYRSGEGQTPRFYPVLCGNASPDAGEQCDDGNQEETDDCTTSCKFPLCGDGYLNQLSEVCDDGNLSGDDACTNSCEYVPCGNGQVDAGEQCDDGNRNDSDFCTNACVTITPVCRDGIKQGDEQCDDGNQIETDACTNNCRVPVCGDAILKTGEQCDDGNDIETDACTSLCKAPFCGDGFLQGSEECDDGNGTDTDLCKSCRNPVCGDGFKQGGEGCDDGNTVNGDVCSSTCMVEQSGLTAFAGNMYVQLTGVTGPNGMYGLTVQRALSAAGPWSTVSLTTAAIDSNVSGGVTYYYDAGGGKRTLVTTPFCGDGRAFGEACDDGNRVNNDACSNLCTPARCGDGVRQTSEECDDGNLTDIDACDNSCYANSLGSWVPNGSFIGKFQRVNYSYGVIGTFQLDLGDGTIVVLRPSTSGMQLENYNNFIVQVRGSVKISPDGSSTVMSVTEVTILDPGL